MRWLLVLAIRVYRVSLGRVRRQRRCLYAETCSRYTERMAREYGFRNGWRAMRSRLRSCRPGYSFLFGEQGVEIECSDGSVIPAVDVSEAVRAETDMLKTSLGSLQLASPAAG